MTSTPGPVVKLRSIGLGDRVWVSNGHLPTASATAEFSGVDTSLVAKSVLLVADHHPVVVVVPGDTRVDTRFIRHFLHARSVVTAPSDSTERLVGLPHDGMAAFGHASPTLVLIDSRLAEPDVPLVVSAGSGWHTARLWFDELLRISNGVVFTEGLVPQVRDVAIADPVRRLRVLFFAGEIHDMTITPTANFTERQRVPDWQQRIDSMSAAVRRASRVPSACPSPLLLQRLSERRGSLQGIHPVVDVYNEMSRSLGIVASAHDLSAIGSRVRVELSDGSVSFTPVGRSAAEVIPAGEWYAADDRGVLCRLCWKQEDASKLHDGGSTSALLYVQGTDDIGVDVVVEALYAILSELQRQFGGRITMIPSRPVQRRVG